MGLRSGLRAGWGPGGGWAAHLHHAWSAAPFYHGMPQQRCLLLCSERAACACGCPGTPRVTGVRMGPCSEPITALCPWGKSRHLLAFQHPCLLTARSQAISLPQKRCKNSLTCSFIHSFFQQLVIKCLQYSRFCAWYWC